MTHLGGDSCEHLGIEGGEAFETRYFSGALLLGTPDLISYQWMILMGSLPGSPSCGGQDL